MSARTEGAGSLPAYPWTQALAVGPVMTVTELTQRVRARLQADPRLSGVAVAGELAGLKRHSGSGHLYFALKDAHSRLACVMWRDRAEQLEFEPRDGLQVVATGYVDVYPAGGVYQLYVQSLYPVGLGLLYARLRALHDRLAREGLFDAARKRPLPRWPRAVGVVTSPDGAAVRDIVAVVRRRSPGTPLYIYPARVQGDGAAEQVAQGLQRLARVEGIEVIILARGGGAADELWTFNDERIVRAIASCPVPVISAVGHETDVTLADLAADRRAPTPSAAAEMAVPDEQEAARAVARLRERLRRAALRKLEQGRRELQQRRQHWTLTRPQRWLGPFRQQLDEQTLRVRAAASGRLQQARVAWVELAARLAGADPLAVLQRGYALAIDPADGRPVRRLEQVRPGQALRVELWDGQLDCSVYGARPVVRTAPGPFAKEAPMPGSPRRGGETHGRFSLSAGR